MPRFFEALATGLISSIPIAGPPLVNVINEIRNEEEATELRDLLDQIVELASANNAQLEEIRQCLSQLVDNDQFADDHAQRLLALENREVRQGEQWHGAAPGRWLYLAARSRANARQTARYAATFSFLWRKFYANGGSACANVADIKVGDRIGLAFRVRGGFRFIAGLRVIPWTDALVHLAPVDAPVDDKPYVRVVDEGLAASLRSDNYREDPVYHGMVGLPVAIVPDHALPDVRYPSPGQNAIWSHDYKSSSTRVPDGARDWIAAIP